MGGLLVGTILTLFDIPIMHTLIDDLNRWLYRRLHGQDLAWPKTLELTPEDQAFIEEFNPEHFAKATEEA